MTIHPTAIVSPCAQFGRDVTIGPFAIIESDVVIGDRCTLEARSVVKRGTILGTDNHVHEGAILGGVPQHLHMPEKLGGVVIGSHNNIRENATIHCALHDGEATVLGDRNLVMVNVHIAHDCRIGNHVVLINNALVAGHVEISDRVYMSGAAAIQQFRRVGTLAAIGGHGRAVKDVPPYVTLDGFTNGVVGLNIVGMRRAGLDRDDILQIKRAYRLIYRSGLTWNEVLKRLPEQFPAGPAAEFHRFLSSGNYGFMPERRTPAAATIKIFPEPAQEPNLRVKAS